MSETIFTLEKVSGMKPTTIKIIVVMILLRAAGQDPITAQMLKSYTNCSDHTITDCMRSLCDPLRQTALRVPGGWRLTEAFQLPLEIGQSLTDFQNREKRGFELQNREFRGFGSPSTSSSSTENLIDLGEVEEEQEQFQNREKRGFENPDSDGPDLYAANCAIALALGIQEPAASRIARHRGVTPEIITGHVDHALAEGKTLGTAIYRILHNWYHTLDQPLPVQKNPEDPHRYANGEFSEFINS